MLFLAHIYYQTSKFDDDSWDSAVIPIYQDTGLENLLNDWFIDASMFEQYLQVLSFVQLANFFSIDYYTLHKCFILLIGPLLIFETMRVTRLLTRDNKTWVLLSGLFVATFPTWPLSVSSVLDYYLLAIWLCMLGSRLAFVNNKAATTAGFTLIIFSTGYGVLHVLSILFLVIHYFESKKNGLRSIVKFGRLSSNDLTLLAAIMIMVCKFIILRVFFPPSEAYVGYNSVTYNLENLSLPGLFYSIKSFTSFLLYPILLIVPATMGLLLSKRKFFLNKSVDELQNRQIYFAFLLVVGSIFPYVLVGKSTSLFWIEFNSGRHAIPLMITLAILVGVLGSRIFTIFNEVLSYKYLLTLVFSSMLLISIFCSIKSLNVRLNYYREVNEIQKTLASSKVDFEPGLINIYVSNQRDLSLNPRDAALLMYRLTGELHFYTIVTGDLNQLSTSMPDPESPLLVGYPIELIHSDCVTNLVLSQKPPASLQASTSYSLVDSVVRCNS